VIIRVEIDGITRTTDSRDPETLARWLVEVFGDVRWTPATWCRVLVSPSWDPDGKRPDWIADSAFMTLPVPVKSPEELVAALGDRLQEFRDTAH
jgi:hypothetical protein